jgi:hypothetical protein
MCLQGCCISGIQWRVIFADKSGRMTADDLWRKSDEYLHGLVEDWPSDLWKEYVTENGAKFFPGGLHDEIPSTVKVRVAMNSLRGSFLFPQLGETHRMLLVMAWFSARGISAAVNSRPVPEDLLKGAEPQLVALKNVIESEVFNSLTDLQKDVVREHYFKVFFRE